MDSHLNTYASGRRFLPHGWGTPSVMCAGPCMGRNNDKIKPVTLHVSPYNQPSALKYSHPSGINQAVGPSWVKNEYDYDNCRGRRFNPPSQENQRPINVELKVHQVDGPTGYQGCTQGEPVCSNSSNPCEGCDTNEFNSTAVASVRPCPVGNKAERTRPILPISNPFERSDKGNFRTTYQADFFSKGLEKPISFKPPPRIMSTKGEFVTDSLYRSDFIRYPIEPFKPASWVREKEYKMPTEKMRTTTSYHTDYQKKIGKPAESAKRKFYLDPNPPHLDDRTCYRIEYVPHCLPEKFCKKTNEEIQNEIRSICVPFVGITTYKRDYQKVKGCPSKLIKQIVTPQGVRQPMQDTTTYSTSFEPYYFDNDDCIPL